MSFKHARKSATSIPPVYGSFRQQFGAVLRDLGSGGDAKPWPDLMVLHGDSDFFLGKALNALREAWQRRQQANVALDSSDAIDSTDSLDSLDSLDSIAINSMDASELPKDGLLDLVLSQSLFEDTQLVIVRRAEKKADPGKMLATLPPTHQNADAARGGWSNRLIMTIEKSALPVEVQRQAARLGGHVIHVAQPVTLSDFMQFIQTALQRARLQLTAEAQQLLFHCCGRDAVVLENEINRLALLFPPDDHNKPADIGIAELSGVLGMLREDEIFRLDELLINRRYGEAEVLLQGLLNRGESVLAVTGVLARHCRHALVVQEEMARRGTVDLQGMATRLRLPQAVIRNFVRYVPAMPRATFERALGACALADIELKTSGLPDGLALSRIVECFQNH